MDSTTKAFEKSLKQLEHELEKLQKVAAHSPSLSPALAQIQSQIEQLRKKARVKSAS